MRWPPEAMGPINGKPSRLLKNRDPKPIKVNEALLKIDENEFRKPVSKTDNMASFEVNLKKGPFRLENMFYNNKNEVVGASYIRVTRK